MVIFYQTILRFMPTRCSDSEFQRRSPSFVLRLWSCSVGMWCRIWCRGCLSWTGRGRSACPRRECTAGFLSAETSPGSHEYSRTFVVTTHGRSRHQVVRTTTTTATVCWSVFYFCIKNSILRLSFRPLMKVGQYYHLSLMVKLQLK